MDRYVKYNDDGEMLDETGKTLYEAMRIAFDATLQAGISIGPPVVMRFKVPFSKIPKFDTKADAAELIIEHVINMEQPFYLAYVMGTNFPRILNMRFDIFLDEPFEEEPDEKMYLEGAVWSKKIVDFIPKYATFCLERAYNLKDRSPAWHKIPASCFTAKLRRKAQEDRLICLPSLELHKSEGTPDCGLFAVLDGHGGQGVAQYAAGHFPYEMAAALEKHLENTGEALKEALDVIDKRSILRCRKEGWLATGSTIVIAAIDDRNIHLRWLGDSPAYMMYESEMTKLTRAHIPRDPDEAKRITDAGGDLLFNDGELRVHGTINVTRALGDISGGEHISKESEVIVMERKPEQYFLMMCCDGISDIFNATQLYEMVKKFVLENEPEEYHVLADKIVCNANDAGSQDNCTCVIAFLRDPKDLWTKIHGSERAPSIDNVSQENSSSDE